MPRRTAATGSCVFGVVLDRVSHGMSNVLIARLSGCDHSCISRYRSGHRKPDQDAIASLIRGLPLNANQERMLWHAAGFLTPAEQDTFNRRYLSHLPTEEDAIEEVRV